MKKWLVTSIVLVMTTALAAGCGGNNGSADKETGNTSKAGSSTGKKTELTFWGDWGGEGQKQFETMVDAFNKSQDKIHVKYVLQQDMITKFLTSATNGGTPDVLFWDRWRTSLYAPKNVLHPVDEYLTRDGISEDDFYSESLRELSYDDKLYGLPLTVDARALFYNKKLLAEAGLQPPTTWDELEAAATKLTKWNGNKLETAGFSMGDLGLFNMYLQQAGGTMLTEDGKTNFNNEQGKQVLEFWDRLMNKDKVYKVGFELGLGEGQDAFVTGKVAMLYSGPWMLSTYNKYGKDLDYGIVPPPAGPNGDKGSVMGGFGLVIPEGSKHKEEAWEFIKWWTANKDNALLWAKTSLNLPGYKPSMEDPFFKDDPKWQPFLETLEFAKVRPNHPGYSVMETDALAPNLQLNQQNKMSIDETLRKSQEEGDKMLKDNEVVK
ncbi:ABC transporter substrate-binding protein [Paenibacillus odorifer]|jgi:multiple sugar transport system substrate-binding protein|uniref:ABC transporter substrate-binding protein n=1 Tax=Paenibacillus TaxID=44249 RepID=UPI00096F2951|nr:MULTISPECIES: ABC transporter substrate-binding protein [Paenibacillus]MDH6428352.1 multiple sugar transport system substrate-binding protein [Paenibacillus sp. PastH-4]MDH6444015.1 multiple sugar transport system substrate-binding protein [Paenibacillus sp. PastF-4]MDH6527919.1 multiple sugar transport system substrate-binding protein [Paenibacillus sp. PastH-3]OMD64356.1 ABC transporter substrate-binding protein [Paenibacillus odorifer]OMD98596.1 ABC transporter substrate-binding protein 